MSVSPRLSPEATYRAKLDARYSEQLKLRSGRKWEYLDTKHDLKTKGSPKDIRLLVLNITSTIFKIFIGASILLTICSLTGALASIYPSVILGSATIYIPVAFGLVSLTGLACSGSFTIGLMVTNYFKKTEEVSKNSYQ